MKPSKEAKIQTLECIIPQFIQNDIENKITSACMEEKFRCYYKIRKSVLAEYKINVNDIYKWLKLYGYNMRTSVDESSLWITIDWNVYIKV